ncbi:MAG: hypothetical protein JWN67_4004 [Actinomycetia bacterium]|nr:hypothetical protein [Actinomycetes bacterium]
MAAFVLTPDEVVVGGISYDGRRLRIRPTLAVRLLNAYGVVATMVIGAGWYLALGPTALLVVPLFGYQLAAAVRDLTCLVEGADGQLVVRNRWRSTVVLTREVARVLVMVTDEPRPPYSYVGQWRRPDLAACDLVLANGRQVPCDAMTSTPRSGGWGFGGMVPAERKAAVLRRWLDLPPE